MAPACAPGARMMRAPTFSRIWARLLYLFPTPLLLSAITSVGVGHIFSALLDLAAYAALMLGAFLLGEGLKAERAFDARTMARPPAFPRKLVAAILAGGGVFLAAFFGWGHSLPAAIAFGALATGSHILAFGLDPMRAKGVAEHGADGERAAAALEKAEAHLAAISDLTPKLGDREVRDRIGALTAEVRQMLTLIEQDPRDLGRARRYLTVYLKGAHDATRKYADNRERLNDPSLRTEYLALIADLEASFGRGRKMLLEDDRTDLEVEIEVLRERLGQEGA
jgi:hypothetical protein